MLRHIKNKALFSLLLGCGVVSVAISSVAFATTHIRANICSAFDGPTIVEPASGLETEAVSVVVKGTGEPDMAVIIIENGSAVSSATVASDGTYAIEVPLVVGDNNLTARETDNCTHEDSASVAVHRTAVQVPPTSPEQPSSPQNSSDGQLPSGMQQPSIDSPVTKKPAQHPSESNFPKPTIKYPADGERFAIERVWVSGTAQPGSVVIIYVNNIEVARTIASDDGTYGVRVALKPGKNTIQVRALRDGESATSDSVTVQFIKKQLVEARPYSFLYSFVLPSVALSLCSVTLVWHIYRRRSKIE